MELPTALGNVNVGNAMRNGPSVDRAVVVVVVKVAGVVVVVVLLEDLNPGFSAAFCCL